MNAEVVSEKRSADMDKQRVHMSRSLSDLTLWDRIELATKLTTL